MSVDSILRIVGFERSLNDVVLMMGLFMGRMIPIVTFNPFLGGKNIPNNVRVGFSAVLFILFYKLVIPAGAISITSYEYIFLLIKEIIFGFAIGFLTGITFYTFIMAGRLMDTSSGFAMISTIAPELQENASVNGQLQFQLAIVIFFLTNGHYLFLEGIAKSFKLVPLLKFPDFSGNLPALVNQFTYFSGKTIEVAVLIAFPIIISVLFTNIFFGLLNRIAPQVNVFFLCISAMSMVALLVLFITAPYIVAKMKNFLQSMIIELNRLIAILS